MAADGRLSARQERGVAALLAHGSIAAAARSINVHERTMRTWLKQQAFASALREARAQLLQQGVNTLHALLGASAAALARNLGCGVPSVEVRAACAAFDNVYRGVEVLDLAGQVAELKEQVRQLIEARGRGLVTQNGPSPVG
jgi:hypothetical protein